MNMPDPMDFGPVSHITADAIGPPGKRVFYLQARHAERVLTLIIEKFQLQALAAAVEQFMVEVHQRFADLEEAPADYQEERMRIHPPVDPLFRVGEMGLGYDPEHDLMVLLVKDIVPEGRDPEKAREVRIWCTRAQLRALVRWGLEVAARGRPICPQCGEPMDPEGHFCPKKNGHQRG